MCSLFSSWFESLQVASDGDGMGSFPEVRSKNARAQRVERSAYSLCGSLFSHAASPNRRTLASESENFWELKNHLFYSPNRSSLQSHLRLSQTL